MKFSNVWKNNWFFNQSKGASFVTSFVKSKLFLLRRPRSLFLRYQIIPKMIDSRGGAVVNFHYKKSWSKFQKLLTLAPLCDSMIFWMILWRRIKELELFHITNITMTSGMTSFFIYFQYFVEAQIFHSSIFRSEISCDVICDVLIFVKYNTMRDLYYKPWTYSVCELGSRGGAIESII